MQEEQLLKKEAGQPSSERGVIGDTECNITKQFYTDQGNNVVACIKYAQIGEKATVEFLFNQKYFHKTISTDEAIKYIYSALNIFVEDFHFTCTTLVIQLRKTRIDSVLAEGCTCSTVNQALNLGSETDRKAITDIVKKFSEKNKNLRKIHIGILTNSTRSVQNGVEQVTKLNEVFQYECTYGSDDNSTVNVTCLATPRPEPAAEEPEQITMEEVEQLKSKRPKYKNTLINLSLPVVGLLIAGGIFVIVFFAVALPITTSLIIATGVFVIATLALFIIKAVVDTYGSNSKIKDGTITLSNSPPIPTALPTKLQLIGEQAESKTKVVEKLRDPCKNVLSEKTELESLSVGVFSVGTHMISGIYDSSITTPPAPQ
jgi:hypothetical protein